MLFIKHTKNEWIKKTIQSFFSKFFEENEKKNLFVKYVCIISQLESDGNLFMYHNNILLQFLVFNSNSFFKMR